jgi:hypothetical protein
MLQLLDLARENAALRCEVTQLRREAEALRRLLSDAPCSCVDSFGSGASGDAGALVRTCTRCQR